MIIFLYGEDTFRSRKKLQELKDKFLREVDPTGSSLITADGENISMTEFNELVGTPSLFARKRMVVVENIFSSKKQNLFFEVLNYLKVKKKKEENILVFWDSLGEEEKLNKEKKELFDFLKKADHVGKFKALSNKETTEWIKKEIESRGGKITGEAVSRLVSFLGNNLWQISNEVDKLLNYKLGQKLNLTDGKEEAVINEGDVAKLIRAGIDENIFALTDAISAKNKEAAVKLLEEQLEAGLAEIYLLSMIARQFKIILQIREALNNGLSSRKIINSLKLHPFIVQKGMGQARNFTLARLRSILNELIQIDYYAKTGRADVKTELSLIIARL